MKDKGIRPGKKYIVNEGFEYHLKDESQGTNGMNNLLHIKWYDYRTGVRTEGHLFFNNWK